MRGMNRYTGKPLSGIEHLKQRVIDVLSTRKGARVGNRQYGSGLYEMVDGNIDRNFVLFANAAIGEAIAEPVNGIGDFKLTKISLSKVDTTESSVVIELQGIYVPTNESIVLEAVLNL